MWTITLFFDVDPEIARARGEVKQLSESGVKFYEIGAHILFLTNYKHQCGYGDITRIEITPDPDPEDETCNCSNPYCQV